jgi:phosphoglucosamine mutase
VFQHVSYEHEKELKRQSVLGFLRKEGLSNLEVLPVLSTEKTTGYRNKAQFPVSLDENGKVTDGDAILYLLGKRLKERGSLGNNKIVVTVMSNSGLLQALTDEGIEYEQTAVGDRFVYECMQKNGYTLGGEQSGHIIMKKYATTGDGILTAIMVAE